MILLDFSSSDALDIHFFMVPDPSQTPQIGSLEVQKSCSVAAIREIHRSFAAWNAVEKETPNEKPHVLGFHFSEVTNRVLKKGPLF